MPNIVAFTGAGISVASGLPTFAVATWRGQPVRHLLSKSFFVANPKRFYEYFWEGLYSWRTAAPNPAHLALAEGEATIITQNIDGLHQAAGSKKVIELHGNLREFICEKCGRLYPVDDWAQGVLPYCPHDDNLLKPNVILFGEVPYGFDAARECLRGADGLLVIGTSLEVAPACYLPAIARWRRIPVHIINDAAEIKVPQFMREKGWLD